MLLLKFGSSIYPHVGSKLIYHQVLPILGALSEVYGPVSVIHLDAHIDTWNPDRYYGSVSLQAGVNHGTFFWHAYEAGYIKPNSSIHAGIRTKFSVRSYFFSLR
jgi:arginase family enzyme